VQISGPEFFSATKNSPTEGATHSFAMTPLALTQTMENLWELHSDRI